MVDALSNFVRSPRVAELAHRRGSSGISGGNASPSGPLQHKRVRRRSVVLSNLASARCSHFPWLAEFERLRWDRMRRIARSAAQVMKINTLGVFAILKHVSKALVARRVARADGKGGLVVPALG